MQNNALSVATLQDNKNCNIEGVDVEIKINGMVFNLQPQLNDVVMENKNKVMLNLKKLSFQIPVLIIQLKRLLPTIINANNINTINNQKNNINDQIIDIRNILDEIKKILGKNRKKFSESEFNDMLLKFKNNIKSLNTEIMPKYREFGNNIKLYESNSLIIGGVLYGKKNNSRKRYSKSTKKSNKMRRRVNTKKNK